MSASPTSLYEIILEWIKQGNHTAQALYKKGEIPRRFHELRQQTPLVDMALTAGATVAVGWLLYRGLHRYKTALDIPSKLYRTHSRLHGRVICVNDSDNLRIVHRPLLRRLLGMGGAFMPSRTNLVAETINIRLAGIDAPEMGHFGGAPQPFAHEAKAWLTKYVGQRNVRIQLHRIDQYGRAVASVEVRKWGFFRRNVSLAMVKAGYATVYKGAGAEYGGQKEQLEFAELTAKRKRLGMWKQNQANYISPAEYKRSLKR